MAAALLLALTPSWTHAAPATGPVITLTATPSYGTAPLLVAFNLTVPSGPAPTVNWSFGDGAYLNGSGATYLAPSHSYRAVGQFAANVTATWSTGSVTTGVEITVVASTLQASITAVPTSGVAPLTVNFTGSATGGQAPYTNFTWEFGDGGSGTGAVLQYTYLTPGTYHALLRVTDDGDRTANATTVVLVVSPALAVRIDATPTAGTVPFNVTFAAIPSGGTGTYVAERWAFGDGTGAVGPVVVHRYQLPGNYTASVAVSDSADANASANVLVLAEPTPFVAQVIAGPVSGSAPLVVGFQAVLSGGTYSYGVCEWRFSDGGAASGTWVNHTFATPNVYVATLTATDSWGATTVVHVSVTVVAGVTLPGRPPSGNSPNATLAPAAAPLWPAWTLALAGAAILAVVVVWSLRPLGVNRAREQEGDSAGGDDAPILAESGSRSPPPVAPSVSIVAGSGSSASNAGRAPAPTVAGSTPYLVAPVAPAGPADQGAPAATPNGGPPSSAAERHVAQRLLRHFAEHPSPLGDGVDPATAHTQAALAEALRASRGAVSKVLRRLEAAGYVESESTHVPGAGRRMRVYRLTPRGDRIARALDPRTGPWDTAPEPSAPRPRSVPTTRP